MCILGSVFQVFETFHVPSRYGISKAIVPVTENACVDSSAYLLDFDAYQSQFA